MTESTTHTCISKIPAHKSEYSYKPNFKYTHTNPYHDKLEEFSNFVYRDLEAEQFKGNWSKKIFKNQNPIYLEIGSGYGHFIYHFLCEHVNKNIVGLDYRFKRTFQLVRKLAELETNNFRFLRAKGERINFLFEENELDGIFYFFPDPWPKNRHHKKRLMQLNFLESAYKALKPGGKLFIKTDHDDYAYWMDKLFADQDLFEINFKTTNLWTEKEDNFLKTFQTKFEKIFINKNTNIKAFILVSNK